MGSERYRFRHTVCRINADHGIEIPLVVTQEFYLFGRTLEKSESSDLYAVAVSVLPYGKTRV